MPYLSGSVIYSLRCSLLHEGNPNVDNDCLTKRNESLPIDHFVLKIERKNDFDIYSDGSGISDMFDQHSRSYRMSIRRVCLIICCVAEAYYKENKEKFHFNYEILDWDKATEHLPPIDMEPGFPNNHTSIQESSNNYCYFWRASNGLTPRSRYSCSCFIRTSPCAGAFPGSR